MIIHKIKTHRDAFPDRKRKGLPIKDGLGYTPPLLHTKRSSFPHEVPSKSDRPVFFSHGVSWRL